MLMGMVRFSVGWIWDGLFWDMADLILILTWKIVSQALNLALTDSVVVTNRLREELCLYMHGLPYVIFLSVSLICLFPRPLMKG